MARVVRTVSVDEVLKAPVLGAAVWTHTGDFSSCNGANTWAKDGQGVADNPGEFPQLESDVVSSAQGCPITKAFADLIGTNVGIGHTCPAVYRPERWSARAHVEH